MHVEEWLYLPACATTGDSITAFALRTSSPVRPAIIVATVFLIRWTVYSVSLTLSNSIEGLSYCRHVWPGQRCYVVTMRALANRYSRRERPCSRRGSR